VSKRIKKGDTVIVTTGVATGKTGKVMQVLSGRVVVEGLNLVKKTLRKSQDNPQGGIVEKESPIGLSNVLLFCPHCKKGVRTGALKDGDKRLRKCKACGHTFES
jgi:large subunit ribosomal protein L24